MFKKFFAISGIVVLFSLSGIGIANAVFPTISSISSTSGSAGNTIVITGLGFTGTTNVIFGGPTVADSYVVNSDSTLSVIVPIGAVSGPIQVVVGNDFSAGSVNYTVTSLGITDPGFATNISDLKDFVTGPVGTGIFGIAVAAVVLMFALRWFKKASNQGK